MEHRAFNFIPKSCSVSELLAYCYLLVSGWISEVATLRRAHHVAELKTWLHRHSACAYFPDLPLVPLKKSGFWLFSSISVKSRKYVHAKWRCNQATMVKVFRTDNLPCTRTLHIKHAHAGHLLLTRSALPCAGILKVVQQHPKSPPELEGSVSLGVSGDISPLL